MATRSGGDPQLARQLRTLVLLLAGTAATAFAAAAVSELLPWTAFVAAGPGLGVAFWLAALPPPPARLRTVGWTLIASSAAATLILIGSLSGGR